MPLKELRMPPNYNENVLILLVQKPETVYAYWELSAHQWKALANKGGLYLRLYAYPEQSELDNGAVLEKEVLLPVNCSNWYFNGMLSEREYYTELGWKSAEGLFIPILRSDPVVTPRNRPVVTVLTGRSPVGQPVKLAGATGRVVLPVATAIKSMVCYMGIKDAQ